MSEFLHAIVEFPTVIFTGMLAVVLLYWLFVVLGAVDIDTLDFDIDIDLDGAVDGAAEAGEGALASLFGFIKFGKVPLTVSVSFIVLIGWFAMLVGMNLLGEPGPIIGLGIFVGATVLAVVATSFLVRPLGGLFETHGATERSDLIGQTCVVRTGRVDANFGQADVEDGGSGHILEIRCDRDGLARGANVLIIDYDPQREAYIVEAIDD